MRSTPQQAENRHSIMALALEAFCLMQLAEMLFVER